MKVTKKVRYVDPMKCNACTSCFPACPVGGVPMEFNFGRGASKAIRFWSPFPPRKALIDPEYCLYLKEGRCGDGDIPPCVAACEPDAIDFDQKPSTVEFEVGAIILAAGAEEYRGALVEKLGAGRLDNVFTSLEFERLLSGLGPTAGVVKRDDGQVPKRIGFVVCKDFDDSVQDDSPVGFMSATAEALGTLAGGVAFTMWWVERMDAFAISAMLSAALLAMVGAAAAARRDRRAQWLNLCCGLLAVLAGAALVVEVVRGTSDRLERASQQRRWADLFPSADEANTPRHLAGLESRFGRIDLGELRSQWTLYLNCRPAATFPNRSALAPWVHLAASQCPRLRRVLIIGQATAELAALCRRYPGVVVESVELDPKVHQVLAAHLRPAPPAPSHFADGRHFIKASARRYDLILLAVGDPTSIATARFYSREFFREVAARLTAEGVLAFALAGPAGKLSPQLREYLGSIYQPLREVFADTLWTWSDPTYVFAARRRGVLTANPEELVARYKGHNGPGEFDPDYFLGWREDMLQPRRLRRLRAMLASLPPGSANTDARPIASFLHLLREEQTLLSLEAGPAGPKRTSLLGLFQRVRLPHALAAMGAIGVLACLAASWQRRGRVPTAGVARPAVLFSLATTGLAAIALEIVLLAAFQNLYGLVYSHIALIVAAYMAGVALGSFVHSRRRFPSQQGAWRRLILLDVALLLACGAVPALVQALGAMPAGPTALLATEWAILVMVAGVGLLGGLAVPLAAGLYGAEGSASTGRVAGAVDAADCLGGAVGGLTCGLILLPLLGAAAACAVYALGKLAAIIALMLGRRGEAL